MRSRPRLPQLERNTPIETLALLGGTPVRPTPLPYARQTIEADDLAAVAEALASDWITQGKHAVAVASGTAALHAACWAAGLGPGDEVITTPLTFAATANAVVYQGARPVFADIDGATLNVDPDAVKRAATERTRAVLPVDLAGLPCDAGLRLGARVLRDRVLEALRAAGVEAVLWQTAPLPVHPLFASRERYPNAEAALASTLVIGSQSYPLFAQPVEVVDAWADGFEKAWTEATTARRDARRSEREGAPPARH